MKPTGWPPARSGTILRLGEKRARRGCSAYASESDIHHSSFHVVSLERYRFPGERFKMLLNTKHETHNNLEILMDSSFFGCIFFGFEALIPL
jgi:hypothetical protein